MDTMNNQKVCISKQATFISLVLLLLIFYVFAAYRTMLNKTSTNSRASNTNIVPVPTLIPILSPNCYDPVPKQRCLKPFYSKGINRFELSLSNEEMQALKEELIVERYSNYAIMSVYKDVSSQVSGGTSYVHRLLKVLPASTFNSMKSSQFIHDDVSNVVNMQKAQSFIIFGVPSGRSPQTGQQANSAFDSCATARNYTVDLCTSVKSD